MGLLDTVRRIMPITDKIQKYDAKSMPMKGPENRIMRIVSDWDYARTYYQDIGDVEREQENWKLYRAFYGDQWPTGAITKLESEGRSIMQFPFLRHKIDSLAGSIIKNWYDIDFVPVEGEVTDLTRILKELFYTDKELLDWNRPYRQSVIDGLIYRGIEQMVISRRYSPLGNIGFERVMPGHVIFDPNWLTDDVWDLTKLWKVAYLTAEEIMKLYKHRSEDIQRQINFMLDASSMFDNGDSNKSYPHHSMEEIYNRKYRVIEYHHMENEDKLIEMDIATGTIIPEGTDDEKREWCQINGIACSDGVTEMNYDVSNYYVTTCCPQLDNAKLLEDRKSEIQIGRLPFFVWSCSNINGRPGSMVDLLKDTQQTLNKREQLVDHIIASSANGALGIDPQLFDGDISKTHMLQQNINNASHKFTSAPGAAERKNFIEVPRSKFPQDVVNEINRLSDYFDALSRQPAALEARSEGAHETGVLFARKQAQAEIIQTTLLKNLEQYWNDKGESYMLLAQSLYSGAYRKFRSPSRKVTFELNQTIETKDGKYKLNDIAKLSRHKVVVSQSPQGISIRTTDRIVSTELLQAIPPEAAVSRSRLTKRIMETMDVKDDERQALIDDASLEHEVAQERLRTEILGLQVQQAQLQIQMAQAQQPQPPAVPEQNQQTISPEENQIPQNVGNLGG